MRSRLPAVFLAALLTFAATACGDESDDSDSATTDETTSQTDDGAADDSSPTESEDADDDGDADDNGDGDDPKDRGDKGDRGDRDDRGDKDGRDEDDRGDKDDRGEKDDENGAIPDDLESDEPDDPDGLPIDAQVVLDTCEDVDPKDTWPAAGAVSFDAGDSNVVATADVKVKGGQSMKVVCDVAGSNNNPQVKAYSPIG